GHNRLPIDREAIVAMLKRLGHLVETAANGREALEILRRKRFALIFMDCRMPEMDGWETTRRIRSGEAGPEAARAPIVALTAHALKEDRRHCVEAGMDDYLSKPPRMDRLKAMIEKWSGKESGAVGAVAEESSRADRVPEEEAAAGGEALPVFNLRALLDRVDGDEDLARTMMEAFFEEAPGQLAELREHLASGGIEDAARMAHSIKGSAGFISGEEVYALAQEMDRLGKAGDLEGMRGKLPEFEKAMERLLEALRRELGKRAQGEAESPDDGSAAR
ncbi:MAG: response regulator, partial [Verrucomicrobia bacterium]|nr:response regulator [Verrucomicrobiota bacterium]